ncbi:MAG: MFS transporter [Longimicrobiales bacterium]
MNIQLGLRSNWRQFSLLVAVNAFVGAMIGLERAVLPLLAEQEFGIASRSAVLSFIAVFGLAKALTNYFAGRWSDAYGRRRVLIAGWLAGIPVPFMLILAQTWSWFVAANVLLGINQGLAWSTTVIMKIDLVGPARRGLAMGLNEFAGYLAVAAAAYLSGWIAQDYGLRPEPFYLGIAFAACGLFLSAVLVRDTRAHATIESAQRNVQDATTNSVFARVSWHDPALASACQAGLVNNLNDGVAWGLFPLLFAAAGLTIREIGWLAFVYPCVWGLLQLATGALSDRWGRKWLIASGMWVQAVALMAIASTRGLVAWTFSLAVLGAGTAMVYPTLLASVGDAAPAAIRARAVGVYRLWRDSGYVVGALAAGVLADQLGMSAAITAVAALTAASGVAVAARMPETLHG